MKDSNINTDSNSMFTFEPNPEGSFISMDNDSSYSVTAPPSSLAQFVALDVVIGFGRESEHVVEYLFNFDQIIHFGGPDETQDSRPGYFIVETTMDEHVVKGDWTTFKDKLKTIATLWD